MAAHRLPVRPCRAYASDSKYKSYIWYSKYTKYESCKQNKTYKPNMTDKPKMSYKTLLFSGGAMRGVAYVGAFQRLRQELPARQVTRAAGVSIGSAFALLWALGYTYDELRDEVLRKDFRHLPRVRVANLVRHFGLDSGAGLREWLETLVIRKRFAHDVTFRELKDRTGVGVTVLATNLQQRRLEVFDERRSPDMSVVEASVTSMSIPLVYTCKRHGGQLFVDGAVLSNLPVQAVLRETGTAPSDLLALKLADEAPGGAPVATLADFLLAVGGCLLSRAETEACSNLVVIDVTGVPYLNWSASRTHKEDLIAKGRRAVDAFFDAELGAQVPGAAPELPPRTC